MTPSPEKRPDVVRARFAQFLLDAIQGADPGSASGDLKRRSLLKLRAILTPRFDPPVTARLGTRDLRVPFSHDLPVILSLLPQYGWNLARLIRAVHDKYPRLTVIDVGANVGDSAYVVRSVSTAPILCVEGHADYLAFLRRNVDSLDSVEIEPSFVGGTSEEVRGMVASGSGTGRIVRDHGSARSVSLRSLSDIATSHPTFATSKFLKIDTDGFEGEILLGNDDYIERARPVLFFEYAPDLLEGTSGQELFPMLRDAGYTEMIIYDNTGDYLLTARLDDNRLVRDICAYYRGRGHERYADIAAFHAEDDDLVPSVRDGELDFFHRFREIVGGDSGS